MAVQNGISPEQRARIEANRQKALERLQQRRGGDAGASQPSNSSAAAKASFQNRHKDAPGSAAPSRVIPPLPRTELTPEQKKRIQQNREHSKGGFLEDSEKNGLKGVEEEPESLQQWKERQKKEHLVKDLAPPLDLANAPKCFECGSLEIDPNLYSNFREVRVCRRCQKEKQDKYSLLTKTECKEDYLLTDPELQDTGLLPRIEKPNPHGFSRMQLFLRFQVEEFAWKKWGSPEGLDKEWERREAMRLQRREKRYQDKLKEMRKKTRAEEYTRKLRNGMSLGERHVHSWSEPISAGGNIVRRRCIDCGIETEEVMI
ncbi:DNA repair protein RAD14 [Candidozyma auris]